MPSFESLLPVVHLFGLALGLGSATAKMRLLLRCKTHQELLPAYIAIVKPITQLIVLGTMLLILSGVTYLLLGYPLSPLLIVKMVLVALIFLLGITIDNLIQPRFVKLAPVAGASLSPEFVQIRRQYLFAEATATGLFYIIFVMWMLR